MAWWEWLVGILMFILALGVLIGIHELGHLGAAKLFNVYCFNYSIGFGPVLVSSKRTEKRETIWTLRAIPLGGFVSMYGEGVEVDEGLYIPPSRSLEGVARYKRAIIVSAGVICNFILGFILILCHNAFFPHISFTLYHMRSAGEPYASSFVVSADESLTEFNGNALRLTLDPLAKANISNNQTTSVYVLNNDVKIEGVASDYILCFKNVITNTKSDPDISSSLALYERSNDPSEAINKAVKDGFSNSTLLTIHIANYNIDIADDKAMQEARNYVNSLSGEERNKVFVDEATLYYKNGLGGYTLKSSEEYKVGANTPIINTTFNVFKKNEEGKFRTASVPINVTIKPNEAKDGWALTGIRIKRDIERYNFGKAMQVSGQEWCTANSTIFVALGQIFTGNIKNVGGIIAIANQSSRVLAGFGFERYIYLWGMISCNLAIVNLLPFPGLDGWSLLVTAYEGIRKKQIPTKFKNIASLIGLALLFGLMIAIVIKDIIMLI